MVLVPGCAGIERGCSGCWAESVGADWIVVELREMDGTPYRCWELQGVSISNEDGSDGIYWLTEHGNLVHVSGSYDRVQVNKDQWELAFAEINMSRESCEKINQSLYAPEYREYVLPKK